MTGGGRIGGTVMEEPERKPLGKPKVGPQSESCGYHRPLGRRATASASAGKPHKTGGQKPSIFVAGSQVVELFRWCSIRLLCDAKDLNLVGRPEPQ
jgi:hypothetical protein